MSNCHCVLNLLLFIIISEILRCNYVNLTAVFPPKLVTRCQLLPNLMTSNDCYLMRDQKVLGSHGFSGFFISYVSIITVHYGGLLGSMIKLFTSTQKD